MDISLVEYAILSIAALTSGIIDAVIGGGGLLQMPVMIILFPEVAHTNLVASTKTSAMAGSLAAAVNYVKAYKINWRYLLVIGVVAALGSVAGTFILSSISAITFKRILWVVIAALTVYTFLRKNLGTQFTTEKFVPLATLVLLGLGIGLYNGAIGPGTGLLIVMTAIRFIGADFLHANAYGKLINAMADFGGVVSFLVRGYVLWQLVLPLVTFMVLGNYIGSKIAIAKGNQFIRTAFLLVMLMLLLKMGYDVYIIH